MDFYVNRTKIGKIIEFESKPIMDKKYPSLEDLQKPMTLNFETTSKTGNKILDKILKNQRKREEEILNNVLKELGDGTRVFHHFFLYKCENCGIYYIM